MQKGSSNRPRPHSFLPTSSTSFVSIVLLLALLLVHAKAKKKCVALGNRGVVGAWWWTLVVSVITFVL